MSNIMWRYVDKRSASVAALKDYNSMQFILMHTDREVADAYDSLSSLRSIAPEFKGKSDNPTAAEERVASVLDQIDVLKKRYQEAKDYMNWFEPAWKELKETERHVLEQFYLTDEVEQRYVIDTLAEEYSIERTSVYKKKNRALDHLALLLYGL